MSAWLQGSSVGNLGLTADSRWPDPFCDIASHAFPRNKQDAFRRCEQILLRNGTYYSALSRVLSYFITDVEIVAAAGGDTASEIGREEQQKYRDFLTDVIGIGPLLYDVGMDYLCYGNSLTSVIFPFRRSLFCQNKPGGRPCGVEMTLRTVYNTEALRFEWTDCRFVLTCPRCGHRGEWKHVDRRDRSGERIAIRRWSPYDIEIIPPPYGESYGYFWKIPADDRNAIKQGHLLTLENTPWEVIEAVRNNEGLLFDPDTIYHMRQSTLAGTRTRGWGISRVLTNFGLAWYVQVLQKRNEVIALDYAVPLRAITPAASYGENQNPLAVMGGRDWRTQMEAAVRRWRQDPAIWNVFPYPVEYHTFGAEASQLVGKDLLELGQRDLLNAIGIPVEMFQGTLSLQAAPPALRLFQANWSHLVYALNRFLANLVEKVGELMGWEPVLARLAPVTHADDLNRQMAKLQLAQAGMISESTGLGSLGLDFAAENRKKLDEEQIRAEETAKRQKQLEASSLMDAVNGPSAAAVTMQQQLAGGQPPGGQPPGGLPAGAAPAAAGAMPPGGAGPSPGGFSAAQQFAAGQPTLQNVPITLDELVQKADVLFQQAMSMTDTERTSFLLQLKQMDETLHALVKSKIDGYRRDAQRRGGAMVMAQEFGGQQ